jgi:hypothetical protein
MGIGSLVSASLAVECLNDISAIGDAVFFGVVTVASLKPALPSCYGGEDVVHLP